MQSPDCFPPSTSDFLGKMSLKHCPRSVNNLINILQSKKSFVKLVVIVGALVQWLQEKTHVQEALSSNPSTLICFKICIVCLKRTKINEKEAENGPFKNAYRNKTYLPIIIGTYLPIIICTYLLKIIGTYLPIIIGTYLPSYL